MPHHAVPAAVHALEYAKLGTKVVHHFTKSTENLNDKSAIHPDVSGRSLNVSPTSLMGAPCLDTLSSSSNLPTATVGSCDSRSMYAPSTDRTPNLPYPAEYSSESYSLTGYTPSAPPSPQPM
ncbi:uncharacterized protein LOC124354541 [Homalodisca vitripennis]|uniref:uncharacterized protein LOC124354541 n=1 Tax=Homalodisca vitripennis TaxID=197043 RepID=UPI001EEC419E|nr:uncharacterized protein LOC124354541 [Homalodisca vitripennis]